MGAGAGTGRGRPLREPTLWFLLIATVVHVVRHNVVDVLVFSGTAALVVLDARRPPPSRWRAGPRPPAAGLLAGVLFGVLVLPLGRDGVALRLVLAGPGVVALVVLWRSGGARVTPGTRHDRRGLPWTAPLVATCLFQLVNFALQADPWTDNPAHPTLSALIDPLLGDPVARALAAGAWLSAGAWLLGLLAGAPQRDQERVP